MSHPVGFVPESLVLLARALALEIYNVFIHSNTPIFCERSHTTHVMVMLGFSDGFLARLPWTECRVCTGLV